MSNVHPPWHKWYKTKRWERRRAYQLRISPWCAECARHGRKEFATVADHVTPHKGDAAHFWLGKLQSLCKPCHDGAKRFAEIRGYSAVVGADGLPLDPAHPFYQGKLP